jgi:hypothetical protein
VKNDVPALLALSRAELNAIRRDLASSAAPQPICHSFTIRAEAEWDEAEERARLRILVPSLSKHGLDVDAAAGALFVEAWELAMPSKRWASETVPRMCAIADEAGFEYEGWTWEPAGRPGYFKRLRRKFTLAAGLITFAFAIEFAWSWMSGEVRGGSPANIAERVAGVAALILLLSLLISIWFEWQERRKYPR